MLLGKSVRRMPANGFLVSSEFKDVAKSQASSGLSTEARTAHPDPQLPEHEDCGMNHFSHGGTD